MYTYIYIYIYIYMYVYIYIYTLSQRAGQGEWLERRRPVVGGLVLRNTMK